MSQAPILLNSVEVQTTSGRGMSPEEVAELALAKIISVGDTAHPVIREQALAFKDRLREVLVFYMRQAVQSDRTTIANRLHSVGHSQLTSLLED